MATTPTAPTFPALRPVLMPCPCCGVEEAGIAVHLNSLDGHLFHCQECDTVFGVAFVQAVLTRWPVLLEWVAQAPQFDTPEEE